jgi:serine phosphatase RsbU (regulator of sigma subunit)
VHAVPFYADDVLVSLRGTTQDVTEQHEAQTALFYAALELEKEQELVEALQRAILPHDLPEVAGVEMSAHYLPASMDVEIGGDWYDAFVLHDGRLCLSVGDVAGHGVQSAATMGQLRNAFRAYALAGSGPAKTLTQLDHLLDAAAESDWSCATCLFVEFTPSTRQIRWARAGHPHPILYRARASELIGAGGPPVGAGVPDYDETTMTLEPGDVLFLYTDGLIERPGEMLDVGVERLAGVIDSLERDKEFSLFATRVCTEVLEDRPRRDDVCVLALRVPD